MPGRGNNGSVMNNAFGARPSAGANQTCDNDYNMQQFNRFFSAISVLLARRR
jgi:hypothetical protein